MPISFQAVEAGQNANRQNWHVKVLMKPNYNSKQKYQDCFSLGKGRFLSWGSSIASGHDLVLTAFLTEETWFYRSTKRFQNQASHATQFSAWLCKALLLLSSCTVWYYSTIVYIHEMDRYGYIHLNKSYRKLHHCMLTLLCQHPQLKKKKRSSPTTLK